MALAVVALAWTVRAEPGDGGFLSEAQQLKKACDSRADVWLCTAQCRYTVDSGVALCQFADPDLAAAAMLADPASAAFYAAEMHRQLTPPPPPPASRSRPANVPGFTPAVAPPAASASIFTAAGASELVVRLLQGLAMVIADRAQREAAAFVLADVRRQLCAEAKDWFPSTCALPGETELQFYGSGATAVQALQLALIDDLLHWPAVAGGKLAEALFVRDAPGSDQAMRAAIASAARDTVQRLVQGEWLFQAVTPLVSEIDTQNRALLLEPEKKPGVNAQWVACAASLPATMAAFAARDRAATPRAVALAALVASPPCWSLFGAGQVRSVLAQDWILADTTDKALERLSTLARLDLTLGEAPAAIGSRLQFLQDAIARQQAAQATPEVGDGGVGGDARTKALTLASLHVSHAGLQLSRAILDNLLRLCDAVPDPAWKCKAPGQVQAVRDWLQVLDAQLELFQAVATGDLQQVVLRSLGLGASLCTALKCDVTFPRMSTTLAAAVALVSAHTSDEVARVLDGLAAPIGSWRTKQALGRFTLSITSHAGLAAAAEWRWGQYGLTHNNGALAWQAPTLAFPVGLELAWGQGCTTLGLLVTLLDPFAFLHYDVATDGQLPGARLLTAFAPGLSFRASLFGSPFGVGPYLAYRPGFRSYQSALNAPGADVLQAGVLLSVDVTLFVLHGSPR